MAEQLSYTQLVPGSSPGPPTMKSRFSSRRSVSGFAFPDHIRFEGSSRRYSNRKDSVNPGMRGFLLPLLLFVLACILLVKLSVVSIFQGDYYRGLSDSNRIHTTVIHAPRGVIFDRNNTPLVFNVPGFRIIEKDPSSQSSLGQAKTVLLKREEAINMLAKGVKDLEVDNLREYPYKEAFSHVIGYIGQITKEELQSGLYKNYRIDDLIGRAGIEQQYQESLKGVDGKKLIEVDATGKPIRTLGLEDPSSGNNITLTLDANLQKAAFLAMEKMKKGAVVVSTPQGEILSILSKPSFDPNLFTLGKTYKASDNTYQNIKQILLDSDNQPLLNRAISGTYPPGSTFKLITAAAGLQSNAIDEHFTVTDNGTLRVGAFSFGNWYFLQYGKTEGELNVVSAIKRSNDIFFYKLAEEIGVENLSKTAESFGLGKRLGIDLKGEANGTVPTDSWKQKVIGEPWYLGDTYHYGIGQGYLLATPLQVNAWTQVIANGGILYQPHLLLNTKYEILNTKLLREKNFNLIREGMIESCSPGGVAWPLFKFKIQNAKLKIDGKNFLEPTDATLSAQMKDSREISIACKTGTAQHGAETDLPHAWITLFAPAYDPQIIVTVLAESSGEGSNVAAPIAKKVLEEWFGR